MKNQNEVLVDELIFESYKNKVIKGSEEFRELIKKNYGYNLSSDLYRKIINYQVKTFGEQLDNTASINYKRAKNHRVRMYDNERTLRRYFATKKLQEIENEKEHKQKSI